MTDKIVPRTQGWCMPAEWETHEATWLAWPHNDITWPGDKLDRVQESYLQMIEALSFGEKVHILVNSEREEEIVRQRLSARRVDLAQILCHEIVTVDAWIRDYGPNFLIRNGSEGKREVAANNWKFNAWGNKYEDLVADDRIPELILPPLNLSVFSPGAVLEGGSIEVNGSGSLLTTEQCLLNSNRNPSLKKEDVEKLLRDYLGVSNIIWLGKGIEGDDTDGHIDDLSRFVNRNTIVTAIEQDADSPNCKLLIDNLKRLFQAKDENGEKFNILELPMPKAVGTGEDARPASYANFYIGNAVVLVPVFDDPNDRLILNLFEDFFPDKTIVGIPSQDLVQGCGGIHCVTQQQPASQQQLEKIRQSFAG